MDDEGVFLATMAVLCLAVVLLLAAEKWHLAGMVLVVLVLRATAEGGDG